MMMMMIMMLLDKYSDRAVPMTFIWSPHLRSLSNGMAAEILGQLMLFFDDLVLETD